MQFIASKMCLLNWDQILILVAFLYENQFKMSSFPQMVLLLKTSSQVQLLAQAVLDEQSKFQDYVQM